MFWKRFLLACCAGLLLAPASGSAAVADDLQLAQRRADLAQYRQRGEYTQQLVLQLMAWHLKHEDEVRRELERRTVAEGAKVGVDPFGPSNDPFGPGGNPFGAAEVPAKPVDPKELLERRVRQWPMEQVPRSKIWLGSFHELRSEKLMAADAHFLEVQLALAHAAVLFDERLSGSVVDPAAALAGRTWRKASGETTAKLLDRLEAESRESGAAKMLAESAKNYREYSMAPFPFAWRDARARWLAWAKTLIDADAAKEPAELWKSQIEKHADDADLYRASYLGWSRARPSAKFEAAIVAPWLQDTSASPTEQSLRVIAVLRTLAARGVPGDHPAREKLRQRLVALMAEENWQLNDTLAIEQLVELAKVSPADHNEAMLRRLCARSPEGFVRYCDLLDIDRPTRAKSYAELPIVADWPKESASSQLSHLASRVGLPIWFDAAVSRDPREMAFRHQGSWREAFAAALEQFGYVSQTFSGGVIWVGPVEAQDAAREFYEQSTKRIGDASPLATTVLTEPSMIFVLETPLDDVIDEIQDRHWFQFHVLGNWKEQDVPITGYYGHLPLHLALSLMCREHGLAWAMEIDAIAIGPPEKVARYSAAGDRFRARQAELAKLPKESPLNQPSVIEFIETPVVDVLAYFSDLHSVGILFDGRKQPPLADGEREAEGDGFPITIYAHPETMAWGLTKALAEHPLDWWYDGEVIYVSSAAGLEDRKRQSAAREAARRGYPEALAKKLQRPCGVEYWDDNLPLAEHLALLGKQPGVAVTLAKDVESSSSSALANNNLMHVPLDKALDQACLELGLSWEIAGEGVVVERK